MTTPQATEGIRRPPSSSQGTRPRSVPVATVVSFVSLAVAGAALIVAWRVRADVQNTTARVERVAQGTKADLQTTVARVEQVAQGARLITEMVTMLAESKVDLSLVDAFQPVSRNFLVRIARVEPHLNGTQISGDVVNTSAVSYSSVSFEVKIGESSGQFSVQELKTASQRAFSAYVPDSDAKAEKKALFREKESLLKW